jgi:hypothetical protein
MRQPVGQRDGCNLFLAPGGWGQSPKNGAGCRRPVRQSPLTLSTPSRIRLYQAILLGDLAGRRRRPASTAPGHGDIQEAQPLSSAARSRLAGGAFGGDQGGLSSFATFQTASPSGSR